MYEFEDEKYVKISDLYEDYIRYDGSKDIRKDLTLNKFSRSLLKCINLHKLKLEKKKKIIENCFCLIGIKHI